MVMKSLEKNSVEVSSNLLIEFSEHEIDIIGYIVFWKVSKYGLILRKIKRN